MDNILLYGKIIVSLQKKIKQISYAFLGRQMV